MKHFIRRAISLMLAGVMLASTVFAFSGCVNPNPDSWGKSMTDKSIPRKLSISVENKTMPIDAVTLKVGIGLHEEKYDLWQHITTGDPYVVQEDFSKENENFYYAVAVYSGPCLEWDPYTSYEEWEDFYFFDEVQINTLGVGNDDYSYTYTLLGGVKYNHYTYVTIPAEFFVLDSQYKSEYLFIQIFLVSKSTASPEDCVYEDYYSWPLHRFMIGYSSSGENVTLYWADINR